MRRTNQRTSVRNLLPANAKGLETHCHQATSKPSCMIASVSASKQGSYHRLSAHLIVSMVGRRDTRLIDALKTSYITTARRHSDRGDPWIVLTSEKGTIDTNYCVNH